VTSEDRLRRIADLAGAIADDLSCNALVRTRAEEILSAVAEEVLVRQEGANLAVAQDVEVALTHSSRGVNHDALSVDAVIGPACGLPLGEDDTLSAGEALPVTCPHCRAIGTRWAPGVGSW
jgi:hypothetical protein